MQHTIINKIKCVMREPTVW